jgi:molybdopterin-guanine dinucleotide biosynthesis protein A
VLAAFFMPMLSGVILAGGKSRRMGQNKALMELSGRPLIARVADRLRAVADEIIISADQVELYSSFADKVVPDYFKGVGTLGGIHAGLTAARHDLALVVGCDMPFLKPSVLAWFVKAAAGVDVVMLQQGEWVEPLHAVYRRRECLPAIEAAIQGGRRRIVSFFDAVRVRYVHPAEIAHLDPDLRSFYNVNTPEDWDVLQLE